MIVQSRELKETSYRDKSKFPNPNVLVAIAIGNEIISYFPMYLYKQLSL